MLPVPDLQEARGPLRAGVLDAHQAIGKSRHFEDRAGVDANRHVAEMPGLDPGHLQPGKVFRDGRASAIHPQGHGRMTVLGGYDRLPVARILIAQLLQPPGRKAVTGFGRRPRVTRQFLLAPQVAAQHRVHQAARSGLAEPLRCLDGMVDDGIGFRARELQLGKADEEQAAQFRMSDRSEQQLSQLRLEQPEGTKSPVADLPDRRPLRGREAGMATKLVFERGRKVAARQCLCENCRRAELDL